MQTPQEINWIAIILPSVVAGAFAIFAQIFIALWLSKKLESYKLQLQSDFQTKFYEFQTRFSILHQKRAEIYSEISAMIYSLMKTLSKVLDMELELEVYEQKFDSFDFYMVKNRLYIDKESERILDSVHLGLSEINKKTYKFISLKKNDSKGNHSNLEKEIYENVEEIVDKLDGLDERFLQILFPEMSLNLSNK